MYKLHSRILLTAFVLRPSVRELCLRILPSLREQRRFETSVSASSTQPSYCLHLAAISARALSAHPSITARASLVHPFDSLRHCLRPVIIGARAWSAHSFISMRASSVHPSIRATAFVPQSSVRELHRCILTSEREHRRCETIGVCASSTQPSYCLRLAAISARALSAHPSITARALPAHPSDCLRHCLRLATNGARVPSAHPRCLRLATISCSL